MTFVADLLARILREINIFHALSLLLVTDIIRLIK